jgi:hypothetical protein
VSEGVCVRSECAVWGCVSEWGERERVYLYVCLRSAMSAGEMQTSLKESAPRSTGMLVCVCVCVSPSALEC